LFGALNIVNNEKEIRGFLYRTALTLAFTVGLSCSLYWRLQLS